MLLERRHQPLLRETARRTPARGRSTAGRSAAAASKPKPTCARSCGSTARGSVAAVASEKALVWRSSAREVDALELLAHRAVARPAQLARELVRALETLRCSGFSSASSTSSRALLDRRAALGVGLVRLHDRRLAVGLARARRPRSRAPPRARPARPPVLGLVARSGRRPRAPADSAGAGARRRPAPRQRARAARSTTSRLEQARVALVDRLDLELGLVAREVLVVLAVHRADERLGLARRRCRGRAPRACQDTG